MYRNWKRISEEYFNGDLTDTQCLNRWYKVLRPGLIKGPWTREEDDIIIRCMETGITKWSEIAERIPGRLGKQVSSSNGSTSRLKVFAYKTFLVHMDSLSPLLEWMMAVP